MPPSKNTFYSIIKESISQFYFVKKKQFHLLLVLIFISSLTDVMSISAIIPVVYLINDSSPIYSNHILNDIYIFLSFSSPQYFILFLLICLVIFILFKNILLLTSIYFQNKFIYSVASYLTDRQMIRFYKSDYLDVKSKNSIEYLRYLAEAPQVFAGYIILPFTLILSESLVVVFIIIALLIYNPLVLLLVLISVVPLGFLLISLAKKKLVVISDKKGSLENESYKAIMEGISAYTDIKLLAKEFFFINKINDKFKLLFRVNAETNLYQWIPRRIIETLVILTICVLYAIMITFFHSSSSKLIIILLSFATACYRLLPSINEILINIVKVKTSHYALKQLSIIEEPITITNLSKLSFNQQIEWKGVNFKYPGNIKNTLSNINLFFQKGQFIILTGDSGNGKTTIGKVLTGFIKPDSGKFLIDNTELENFNQIKHLLAYVTQDFYLLDKTIIENIAFGEDIDKIDMNRIEEIIQITNLSELIKSLPLGIYQIIGEMGAKLSGGQKQRIAIARCLYKKAQVLVLDEATNSLDKENETEILDTIYSISKKENITVLIITHNTSIIKKYDEMYIVENGNLIRQS